MESKIAITYAALHGRLGAGLTATQRLSATSIVLAVLLAILATEPVLEQRYGQLFEWAEVVFAIIFSVEYIARVWSAGARPEYAGLAGRLRYMATPFPILDLVALIPFLLGMGAETMILRILRLFRLLALSRLMRYSQAMQLVIKAVYSRRFELTFSLALAGTTLLLAATVLYIVEGDQQPGFASIPRAAWWAVATLTTVGYGDVLPITPLGKVCAGLTAIAGIGMVAMPAGILAAAFSEVFQKRHGGNE